MNEYLNGSHCGIWKPCIAISHGLIYIRTIRSPVSTPFAVFSFMEIFELRKNSGTRISAAVEQYIIGRPSGYTVSYDIGNNLVAKVRKSN